jgi:hypothetical protein
MVFAKQQSYGRTEGKHFVDVWTRTEQIQWKREHNFPSTGEPLVIPILILTSK